MVTDLGIWDQLYFVHVKACIITMLYDFFYSNNILWPKEFGKLERNHLFVRKIASKEQK